MSPFKVTIRDKTFSLSKEQILFDSPNYFSTYFLGDFSEAAEGAKQLTLQRHPALFDLIYEYLTGYDIFPIPELYIPSMVPMTILQNLHKDALFYGLDDLVSMTEKEIERITPKAKEEDDDSYTIVTRDRACRLFPRVHPIPKSVLPEYLEHFKKGDLLLQDRDWLFTRYRDKALVTWNSRDYCYAILKGYSEDDKTTLTSTSQIDETPDTVTTTRIQQAPPPPSIPPPNQLSLDHLRPAWA